jgi:hypothetical protein
MKLDTFILLSKLFAYTLLGALVPMGTALQQWINSGEWPPNINWIGIAIGGGVGACTNYLAFFSSAWATWKDKRINGNGSNSNGATVK